MITIPEKIKILGLEFAITHDQHASDAAEAYGTTVLRSQKINIEPSATELHQQQVFIHELLHAIWWQMGLSKMKGISNEAEEQIITGLANGFYTVIKDNHLFS